MCLPVCACTCARADAGACVCKCVHARVCAGARESRSRGTVRSRGESVRWEDEAAPRRMAAAQRCDCAEFHCSASQAARGARFKLGRMGSGDPGLGRWEAAGGTGGLLPRPLSGDTPSARRVRCHRRRVTEGAGAVASGSPAGGAKRPPRSFSKALRGTSAARPGRGLPPRPALPRPRRETRGGRAPGSLPPCGSAAGGRIVSS